MGLDESSVLKGRQAACDFGGGMGGELLLGLCMEW